MNPIKTVTEIIAVVMAFLMGLTATINSLFNGDIYPYESNTRTVGLETFTRSQGVTTDGESWIFSGDGRLTKVSLDGETEIASNKKALAEFERYGSDHIGGISYYDGKVYASVEDGDSFAYPIVAVYDSETLEFTGKYKVISTDILFRGCPWVCCDAQRGVFYVGNSRNCTEIYAFDIETMEYKKTIPLESEIFKIQGAEMYDGYMLAATNDSTRAVYALNVETGKYEKMFDRIMYVPRLIDNFGGEGEDITVLAMEDGTLFHALDIGALFIDSNLRHYKPIEEK